MTFLMESLRKRTSLSLGAPDAQMHDFLNYLEFQLQVLSRINGLAQQFLLCPSLGASYLERSESLLSRTLSGINVFFSQPALNPSLGSFILRIQCYSLTNSIESQPESPMSRIQLRIESEFSRSLCRINAFP